MKTLLLILLLSPFIVTLGQIINKNDPPKLVKASKTDENGQLLEYYHISVVFDTIKDEDRTQISNKSNWSLNSVSGQKYDIKQIKFTPNKKMIYLEGDFEGTGDLSIEFNGGGGQKLIIKPDSADNGLSKFSFGKGKPIELSLRRIASDAPLYAIDYNSSIDIFGNYFTPSSLQGLYFKAYSINLTSKGTFTNSISIPNSTQTSVDLKAVPYINTEKSIYRNEIYIGYQFETTKGLSYFDIINKTFKAGLRFEIPYTNYPMYYLHQSTGYLRMAMPLIINFDYLPKGSDGAGNTTLSRFDFNAIYELAFSPYLIIKGEWGYSKFMSAPSGVETNKNYTAISIAQDLKVLSDYIGILKLIMEDNLGDKNFIFYKIESGSRAPAFINVSQQSFGLGMYF